MRLSRLLAILAILSQKEKVTAYELAERFEVSVRTIHRDMQTINEAGFPVVSFQGYQGGYGLIEGYLLDRSILSEEELQIGIATLRGINDVLDNRHIRNLMDKLEFQKDTIRSSCFSIDLTEWGASGKIKELLAELNQAIESHRCVEITYIGRKGEKAKREIEPLHLILKASSWYIYAYCRLREDFRLFKLGRILDLELLETLFEPKDYQLNMQGTDGWLEDNVIRIELKFKKDVLSRLYDYFSDGDIRKEADGFYVTICYPEDEWVYSTILSFGDQVEVISPVALREKIKERLSKAIENYK